MRSRSRHVLVKRHLMPLMSLAVLLLTTIPRIVYRIRVEERIMTEHFGRAWQEYRRRTRALVPLLW